MLSPPKLFISYSWSTPDHEQWVVELAEELVNNAVQVIFDKWDLRDGHDSVKFMEQIANDPSIKKVLLICDRVYAQKANSRTSGVGTETQIISAEIYSETEQDKYLAVIVERDEKGKAFVPTYYKYRIYIDLSNSEKYSEEFEKLLRWIFDKPLYVKPPLGTPPSFVTSDEIIHTGTSSLAKRVIEALKMDKGYARGSFDEYLTVFSSNLEKFRMPSGSNDDEIIIKSIDNFLPSRNEYLKVITVLCQYSTVGQYANRLHRFFESLIPYFENLNTFGTYLETDYDNFRFIIHELFLYTISIFLTHDKLEEVHTLLSLPYFFEKNTQRNRDGLVTYSIFRRSTGLLNVRNTRLNLRRLSLRADLIKDRTEGTGISFSSIMQADFVCYLRCEITNDSWYPETLVYATHQYSAFEIFSRAKSRQYLARILHLLGISDLSALHEKISTYSEQNRRTPRWEFDSISIPNLLGATELGTRE